MFAYAVVRCLPVCPSRLKRVNIFNFFHDRVAKPFPYHILWQRAGLSKWGKNRDFRPVSAYKFFRLLWHRSLLDRRVSSTFRRWSIMVDLFILYKNVQL